MSDSPLRWAIGRPHRPPDVPTCRSQHRPAGLLRPTGRSGSWVDSGHQVSTWAFNLNLTSGPMPRVTRSLDRRSAGASGQRPPDVPGSRSQPLPLGLGRRAGPAAGLPRPVDPKSGNVVVICILTELITARTCSCTVETGACERWDSADLRFSTLAPRCPNHAPRMWAWDRCSTAEKPRRRGAQVLLHGRDGRMRAVG